jgi:nucleotide-binding universal stress UspA family protein
VIDHDSYVPRPVSGVAPIARTVPSIDNGRYGANGGGTGVAMRVTGATGVVVGANGTSAGLAAVRLAARESVARGQPLRVVHAFAWPGYDVAAGGVPYDELRGRAAEVLARAVTTAIRSAPAADVAGFLVDGPPARVLLQQSRTAQLLVLGDDDPGAVVRLPTDSVLAQAVARSRCPVLLARGVGRSEGPVVVGVDGSAAAGLALQFAVAEAARRHAPLEVLHAWEPKDGGPGAPGEEQAAQAVLDAAVQGAVPGPTEVLPRLVRGDPAGELIAASGRARLLVIGPSGADGRFGALLGAAAQTVLRRGCCPIVFVHGARPGPSAG